MSNAPAYTYDPIARQYRDTDGKVIAAAVILALRNAIADGAGSEFVGITTAYLKGDRTLSGWADAFATTIVGSAAAGYLLGRGGTNALTPLTDDPRLHALTDYHLKAARGFGVDLAASGGMLTDQSPMIDGLGDLVIDENGDVIDDTGNVMLDENGDPISADAAGSLLGGVLGLLARAASYDSAAIAGYSSGQGGAWGAELPEVPPAHQNCQCSTSYTTDADGQILGSWDAQAGACVICVDLDAQYTDYETGVYVTDGAGGDEGG